MTQPHAGARRPLRNPSIDAGALLARHGSCRAGGRAVPGKPGAHVRTNLQLLGGQFGFESASGALLDLVESTYAGVPQHRFPGAAPEFRVELRLVARARRAPNGEPPDVQAQTATALPCAVIDDANFAVAAPEQRRAIVVVSEDMLAHPYHLRSSLLEFVVFILAARGLGLVPLHAACIGAEGRGVLLLGDSGSGKSTMALLTLLRGLELLAEDAVFVQPEGMLATGVANYLHLRDSALGCLDKLTRDWIHGAPVIRRRSGVEKFEVDVRQGPIRLAATPLELTGAVFLSTRITDQPETLLRPIRADRIDALLTAGQPYAATQPGWHYFRHKLAGLGIYELYRGRHPQDAIHALQRLLGR